MRRKSEEHATPPGMLTDAAHDQISHGPLLIRDGAITAGKLADGSVTEAKVASAAISTAKIADAAITNAKIGSAAVTSAEIQDATITAADVGSLSANDITAGTITGITYRTSFYNSVRITMGEGNLGDTIEWEDTSLNYVGSLSGALGGDMQLHANNSVTLSAPSVLISGWTAIHEGNVSSYAAPPHSGHSHGHAAWSSTIDWNGGNARGPSYTSTADGSVGAHEHNTPDHNHYVSL